MKTITLIFILVLLFSACSPKPADEHAPETSLADLKVFEGLQVELFASEPMFSNPTNMDIDARGRVWITEAYNYRNQYNPKNPVKEAGDRIMILEDTDHDGKADNSKVYYQGPDINAALGICVLGNKVIVSCAPNVFVFTDDNGDDVPDKKEILFQGIKGVQHDHAIHAFNFAYDGRIYFNMGNEGSILVDAKGDTVIDKNNHKVVTNGKPFRDGLVLRMNEDGTKVEVVAHNFRNNYELTVDPYGTIWQSDNDDDGNKGTRINFVMEYGNYGFKDEMTGASWPARRTNMEKEIPLRHWHLNDPGVVPNLLQTGSGSPTGITMYEGGMLPNIFYGQLIHAEPGHNVIRSYPVEPSGAGYKATIVNILEGQKDQWFRPADVTIAPDGSLFVADWYDPGVGGHQVGDLDRGRIYRISINKSEYNVDPPNLTDTEQAKLAMLSPNPATRYLGWKALEGLGQLAEPDLKEVWTSNVPRQRAMAFWLLIRLPNGAEYIEQAMKDKDPNFRIMALRASRLLNKDVLSNASRLVNDSSAQVRREVAIAIRGNNSIEAADLWTKLAQQYDGRDRWYLEALGIAAEGNWDLYFSKWRASVGSAWNSPAGRDIVWRSRSRAAMPLLADLIKTSGDSASLRYFRAFDFQTDASKQQILASLVPQVKGEKLLYTLKHMDASKFKMTPAINAALQKTLSDYKDKIEFVELVNSFEMKDRAKELLALAIKYPDSLQAREAMRTLLRWNRSDIIEPVLRGSNKEDAIALARVVDSSMGNEQAIKMMEGVMMDSTRDLELRKLAVRAFGGPWQSEDRLLVLAKEKKIPADLQSTAAGVFQTVWRAQLREEAAKYLPMPGIKDGKPLSAISTLAYRQGDVAKGQTVFENNCAQCHTVKGKGTNFGPDLSEIGDKLSKEGIFNAILFPDLGISFGYEGYLLKLNDGTTAVGRIISETADKIELQYMSNTQTLKPSDVASKTKLPNSLMPGDLQRLMTEDELVDLVEYLKQLKNPATAYSPH
ncbi:MAG: PVC-type heme-binding CxxCH protein [Bacteroidota bacterium]